MVVWLVSDFPADFVEGGESIQFKYGQVKYQYQIIQDQPLKILSCQFKLVNNHRMYSSPHVVGVADVPLPGIGSDLQYSIHYRSSQVRNKTNAGIHDRSLLVANVESSDLYTYGNSCRISLQKSIGKNSMLVRLAQMFSYAQAPLPESLGRRLPDPDL